MCLQSTLFPEITAIAKRDLRRGDTQRLYNDIREEYKRMYAMKKHGQRIYTDEYIFAELSCKFYRSPRTIENIVFYRV